MAYSIWGIDISRWQNRLNWKPFVAGGLRFAIIKGTDGLNGVDSNFNYHYNDARNAGVGRVGFYSWFDPKESWNKQADDLLTLASKNNPDVISLDLEQWWANWDQYNAYLKWLGKPADSRGDKPPVDVISANIIDDTSHKYSNYVKANTNKPVLEYTGWGYVQSYSPQMMKWVANEKLWLAQYINFAKYENKLTSWADMARILAKVKVPWMNGDKRKAPDFWQFASCIIYPDTKINIDTSVFCGNDAEFDAFFSGVAQTPVPVISQPQPEMWKVSSWVKDGLNVRLQPNTLSGVIDGVHIGNQVEMIIPNCSVSGPNIWSQIRYNGKTGYIASSINNRSTIECA